MMQGERERWIPESERQRRQTVAATRASHKALVETTEELETALERLAVAERDRENARRALGLQCKETASYRKHATDFSVRAEALEDALREIAAIPQNMTAERIARAALPEGGSHE